MSRPPLGARAWLIQARTADEDMQVKIYDVFASMFERRF